VKSGAAHKTANSGGESPLGVIS